MRALRISLIMTNAVGSGGMVWKCTWYFFVKVFKLCYFYLLQTLPANQRPVSHCSCSLGAFRSLISVTTFDVSPFVQVYFASFKSRYLMLLSWQCESCGRSDEQLERTTSWNCACLRPYTIVLYISNVYTY